jgi:hypothetical protein
MDAPTRTDATHRTYLVECYAPGIEQPAVEAAAGRARAAAAGLRASGGAIEYLGAWLVASDEVVFHSFRADDLEIVRAASTSAALAFERIVESVGIGPDGMPILQPSAPPERPWLGEPATETR